MIILLNTLLLTKLFFCPLFLLSCTTYINIFRLLRCIYDQSYTVIYNLRKSCSYSNLFPFRPVNVHPGNPDCHRDHHILMMGKDSFLTIRCRNSQFLTSSCIEHSVTRYDFKTKCIHMHSPRYYACASSASAFAFAMTSSIVPTLKNALSGYSSISPSMIILNPRIVSFSGTYFPGIPVNVSATKNG